MDFRIWTKGGLRWGTGGIRKRETIKTGGSKRTVFDVGTYIVKASE